MTEKEYRECIAAALCPEYEAMLCVPETEHQFSERFERNMQKLIRRRNKPYYRFINTLGKRAAVIVIAFLTISFTTVVSIEALRTPFLDFIMSIFSDHSEVRTFDEVGDYPEKIESYYEITYDLSDYSITKRFDDDSGHTIHYQSGETVIYFSQSVVKGFRHNYNTEDTEIELININGIEAMSYLDNHNYNTLIWNNGEYIIQIGSNTGKDVLIEIAKSVQKVE